MLRSSSPPLPRTWYVITTPPHATLLCNSVSRCKKIHIEAGNHQYLVYPLFSCKLMLMVRYANGKICPFLHFAGVLPPLSPVYPIDPGVQRVAPSDTSVHAHNQSAPLNSQLTSVLFTANSQRRCSFTIHINIYVLERLDARRGKENKIR